MPSTRNWTPVAACPAIIPYLPAPIACSAVTDGVERRWKNERMTAESLRVLLQEFLGGSRHAVVLEDGARVFDLAEARYSISGEYNKCLLHLWSAERNAVRRILDAEVRNGSLRLMGQKLGPPRPPKPELCP